MQKANTLNLFQLPAELPARVATQKSERVHDTRTRACGGRRSANASCNCALSERLHKHEKGGKPHQGDRSHQAAGLLRAHRLREKLD